MRSCWTMFLLAKGGFKLFYTLTNTPSRVTRIQLFTHFMEVLSSLFHPSFPPHAQLYRTNKMVRFLLTTAGLVFLFHTGSTEKSHSLCAASLLCAGRALQMEDDLVIAFQLLLCTLEFFIKRCPRDLLQPLYRKLQCLC